MLKVYYIIEKELQSIGDNSGLEETTGHKTVTTYTVENGELNKFFDLELLNEENSKEFINDYLVDNGYNEKDIKLIQL